MLDLSPEKLLVVSVVALAILGPQRIPQLARSVVRARRELRRLTNEVHPDAAAAVSNPRGALMKALAEPRRAVAESVSEPRRALSDAVAEPRTALADAISQFQFGAPPSPASKPAATAAEPAATAVGPTPDDPALN